MQKLNLIEFKELYILSYIFTSLEEVSCPKNFKQMSKKEQQENLNKREIILKKLILTNAKKILKDNKFIKKDRIFIENEIEKNEYLNFLFDNREKVSEAYNISNKTGVFISKILEYNNDKIKKLLNYLSKIEKLIEDDKENKSCDLNCIKNIFHDKYDRF